MLAGQRIALAPCGITATGDTSALHEVIDARVFDSAQVSYNLFNASAATASPQDYLAQDYGKLFDHTEAAGVGVVGIRVLAGGALSGSAERHPIRIMLAPQRLTAEYNSTPGDDYDRIQQFSSVPLRRLRFFL